jgi:hypothetical protein
MAYIVGFAILVAVFAIFPRTAIIFTLLIGGALYFALTHETPEDIAWRQSREREKQETTAPQTLCEERQGKNICFTPGGDDDPLMQKYHPKH